MTTSDVHEMLCTDRDEHVTVFSCSSPGCGRTIALHAGGGRTVLDAGDAWAPHRGGLGVVVGSSAP